MFLRLKNPIVCKRIKHGIPNLNQSINVEEIRMKRSRQITGTLGLLSVLFFWVAADPVQAELPA